MSQRFRYSIVVIAIVATAMFLGFVADNLHVLPGQGWRKYGKDYTPPIATIPITERAFDVVPTFSPDQKQILIGNHLSSSIRLIDMERGSVLRTLKGEWKSTQCVAFLPDGNRVLTGGDHGVLRLWELNEGKVVAQTESRNTYIRSIAIAPSGEVAASGGDENDLLLWRLSDMSEIRRFIGHTSHIHGNNGLAFSQDGTMLASGSWDGSVRVWNVETGEQIVKFDPRLGRVLWVLISPDGKYVLSAYLNGNQPVIRWDIESGEEVNRFGVPGNPWFAFRTLHVESAALSSDGSKALFALSFGTVMYWDVENWKEIAHNRIFNEFAAHVTFSSDGTRAIVIGDDEGYSGTNSEIRIWQLPVG